MVSRKKINLGTFSVNQDGGMGSYPFFSSIGLGPYWRESHKAGLGLIRLELHTEERHGRETNKIVTYPEPSGRRKKLEHHGSKTFKIWTSGKGTDDDDDDVPVVVGGGACPGEETDADVDAFFAKQKEKEPADGKWHLPIGEKLCGCHKRCPLTLEVPCGPIPVINPGWYVACKNCYGEKFEEKTGDCASCGSRNKFVLHFDKECHFCGKELPDYSYPFHCQPNAKMLPKKHEELRVKKHPFLALKLFGPGIKKRRHQGSRKKIAKKQKELDTVVPGDLA